ncbi:MAG: carbohydrate ABC transporter permease [Treponema sp.]|jgi:multiple sugar transport system permease protein|nr:carbohydrate ABC transporter permease [Treponema sp.]
MKDDSKSSINNGVIRTMDLKQTPVRILYGCILAVGITVSFIGAAPLIWVFLSGFKEIREFVREPTILPRTFDFGVYVKTWNQLHFGRYYLNSLISVTGSVVCAVFFNGLLGYALSKVRPVGSKIILSLVMWCLLIPGATSVVPLFININKLGLTESFIPLWFSIGASAFFVVLFKNFFDELPQSLVDAARIDGAGNFTIFARIAIPLSKAIIIVIVMYSINRAWSDFLLPFLILSNSNLETVMVRLFYFKSGDWTSDVDVLRAVVFAVIPPIVLFFIFQKQIAQVTIHSGIKG